MKKRNKRALLTIGFSLFIVFSTVLAAMYSSVSAASVSSLSVDNEWKKRYGYQFYSWLTGSNSNGMSFWQDTSQLSITKINQDTESTYIGGIGEKIDSLDTATTNDKVSNNDYDPDIVNGYDDTTNDNQENDDENESYNNKAELYYTVENDKTLGGYYRQYYVWNANQLSYILKNYQDSFDVNLKAQANDLPENTNAIVKKLGIVLLCDIDLGGYSEFNEDGSYGEQWIAYRNLTVFLHIDGQGNTIYNGYFKDFESGFIGAINTDNKGVSSFSSDQKFAIENLVFSNMFINRAYGMFGNTTQYAYFHNVNFTKCLAYGDKLATSIIYGYSNNYVYMKDCTISESYVYGGAHSSLYSSYNGSAGGFDPSSSTIKRTYLGDTNEELTSNSSTNYYFAEIPDRFTVENFESISNISSSQRYIKFNDYNNYSIGQNDTNRNIQLAQTNFPSIYQNCAAIDCEVYVINSGNHSGGFISCIQGGMIFKDCFSNTTMYCAIQTGVFTGACIGSGNGFYYPVEGEETFVNTYFENCYTYGAIEGTRNIGGFVGMIFNDLRQTRSGYRGICVFKDCYSTSSVGMQYSGRYVGGFVGYVVGNTYANEWVNNKTDENDVYMQHRFINCYAAGEVGGILTDVYSGLRNDVTVYSGYEYYKNPTGGFIGYYEDIGRNQADNDSDTTMRWNTFDTTQQIIPIFMKNSYYDMQTTAMRERDIGGTSLYETRISCSQDFTVDNFITKDYFKDSSSNLGTIDELEGLYTQKSESKNVQGLTDINMGNNWENSEEYYPQLKSMTSKQKETYQRITDSSKAEQMKKKRALRYYTCSFTSTSTVLLDHYDTYMNTNGTIVEADETTYDTVRDITRKFTFTSHNAAGTISWSADETRNKTYEFYSQLGKENNTMTLSYDNDISISYIPHVLTITKDKDTWKCTDFAPGKQWVQIKYTYENDSETRDFRLLPKAYLNAGGVVNVNVNTSDNDISNTINLYINKNSIVLNQFNHYVGVMYAITDFSRMGTDIYNKQTVTKYNNSNTDSDSFAFYSGYLLTGNSNAIGLNDDGQMYEQNFSNNQYYNQSINGRTMVKVFNAKLNSETETVDKGSEITDTDELKKFKGEKLFDASDNGRYYYMTYYWRLDDGRWLEDEKLVYITANNYTVEMITGILDQPQVVDETQTTGSKKTAIDQYVTDQVNPSSSDNRYDLEKENNLSWYKNYPSDNTSDLLNDSDGDNTDLYYQSYSLTNGNNDKFTFQDTDTYKGDYNYLLNYGNETYYAKSTSITTNSDYSIVGWRRSTEYKLTTLIIEVNDGGEWIEMTRVNGESSTDYNDAQFSHTFTSYTVTQDSETKLYSINVDSQASSTFKVESSSTGLTSLEKYIKFAFQSDDNNGTTVSHNTTNIRVIALFRDNEANVEAEKFVLFGESHASDLQENISLATYDKNYEVDNVIEYTKDKNGYTFKTSNDDRKRYAVLAGDTLTYRVKLSNSGYLDSSTVKVFDTIPQGCTYIDNSMAIYRQQKDSDAFTYQRLEKLTAEPYQTTFDKDKQSLTWIIPGIELNYDYYVEYQVKVNQLDYAEDYVSLANTASWDFISMSGDMRTENGELTTGVTDLDSYLTYTNFDMSMEKVDENQTEYTVSFTQKTNEALSDICFENRFPNGFAYTDDSIIITNSSGKCEYKMIDTDYSYNDFNNDENNKLAIELEYKDNQVIGFKIYIKEIGENNGYDVSFKGTQSLLQEPKEYYNKSDIDPYQIQNKASITYSITEDGEKISYGNSITETYRLTNQVSTDVTWLCLNIEKTIQAEDPLQSFLFKIENNDTNDVYYTRVNCTSPNDDKTSWSGNQCIKIANRGTYQITEINDWSMTDYDFDSADGLSNVVIANYLSGAKDNSKINSSGYTVTVTLPTVIYKSTAFPTAMGTTEEVFPVTEFKNNQSYYDYRSSQYYVENKIESESSH